MAVMGGGGNNERQGEIRRGEREGYPTATRFLDGFLKHCSAIIAWKRKVVRTGKGTGVRTNPGKDREMREEGGQDCGLPSR